MVSLISLIPLSPSFMLSRAKPSCPDHAVLGLHVYHIMCEVGMNMMNKYNVINHSLTSCSAASIDSLHPWTLLLLLFFKLVFAELSSFICNTDVLLWLVHLTRRWSARVARLGQISRPIWQPCRWL